MTIIELEILIRYLDKVIYFVHRNLGKETNPNVISIMSRLANTLSPIRDELRKLQ